MPERSDGGGTPRPLPSVGIPLLRDELRASRLRRTIALVLGAVLLVGGAAAAIVLPWMTGSPEERATSAAESAPAPEPVIGDEADAGVAGDVAEPAPELTVSVEPMPDGDGTRTVRRFGDTPGFRPALVAAGLSGAEADALIAALNGVMDFRRCRPEHQMTMERAADGTLRRFEYKASITQIYEVVRDDEGALTGRQVEVPIERTRLARGGTIRSSLGSALERAGLGRAMVGVFVEVFEREVSFATDTRAGDTFRILVDEERIAGQLLRFGTVHAIEVRGQRIGSHQAFWYAPTEALGDFYDANGRALNGGWLRTPLRYDHISSPFDPRRRHPILRRIVPHNGIDFAAPSGTPVWAAADGEVTFVGPRGPNGNLVSLRHENGYESHYAHLSRFAPGLARGAHVRQRQLIGYVGSTGRSTGPHLHFGLKHNGRFIDPATELNGPGRMMPSAYLARYRREVRARQAELARISVDSPPDAPADEAAEEPPAEEAVPTD